MTADQSNANPNRLYFGDNLEILRKLVAGPNASSCR